MTFTGFEGEGGPLPETRLEPKNSYIALILLLKLLSLIFFSEKDASHTLFSRGLKTNLEKLSYLDPGKGKGKKSYPIFTHDIGAAM